MRTEAFSQTPNYSTIWTNQTIRLRDVSSFGSGFRSRRQRVVVPPLLAVRVEFVLPLLQPSPNPVKAYGMLLVEPEPWNNRLSPLSPSAPG